MTFRESQKSQTLILNELSQKLEAEGKTIYKYGFGQSPFLPLKRVQEAFQEAVTRVEYAPVQGLEELRVQIANFHTHAENVETHAKDIIVASGSKSLLLNTMMAFEDAVVFLPSPSWVSYAPQAKLAGHAIDIIPTDYEGRWRIDPEVLDTHLSNPAYQGKSKIIVINYPGNPDGLTYSASELQALTEVLDKHEVWVMADEIYAMLHHQDKHVTLRQFYPERTLVTTGLSKWSGAGGWRLGVQILPPNLPTDFRKALLAIASSSYSCAPTPIQVAATVAYQWDNETQTFLNQQREILKVIGQQIYEILHSGGIAVHPPEGAFYLMLDFSPMRERLQQNGIKTDVALCEALLAETGVILLPGSAFGVAEECLTARLGYVDFAGSDILAELEHHDLTQLVDKHCSHMIEGIHKLVEWLA